MEKFYSNIGKKIMLLAKVCAILLTAGGIITGIVFMSFGYVEMIFGGIATIIASPFVAFISTMMLYGFGKLIDTAEKIEAKMCKNVQNNISSTKDEEELPEI